MLIVMFVFVTLYIISYITIRYTNEQYRATLGFYEDP